MMKVEVVGIDHEPALHLQHWNMYQLKAPLTAPRC
jgi:hypothetical protein